MKYTSRMNRNGFSLVEALISLSIVSVISLAIAQMARDSSNSMNYSESKFDELELARQIQMQVGTKTSCEKNFTGKLVSALNVGQYVYLVRDVSTGALVSGGGQNGAYGIANFSSVVDIVGNKVISTGDIFGNRSLKITRIDFLISPANWNAYLAVRTSLPAGSLGVVITGNLQLIAERVKTEYGGKAIARSFPVNILLNANGIISGCYTEADVAAQAAVNLIQNQFTEIINNTNITSNTIFNTTPINPTPIVSASASPSPTPTITPTPGCPSGARTLPALMYCFFQRFPPPPLPPPP